MLSFTALLSDFGITLLFQKAMIPFLMRIAIIGFGQNHQPMKEVREPANRRSNYQ
ncbi:MAG: hypothetical protein IJJ69_09640 [Oscillospiraceae bacterium]|nr:hypothetical protein [Oscillospiraceae bacterium]